MSRSSPRPTRALTLTPVLTHCPACQHALWSAYDNERTVTTLKSVLRLTLRVRRCPNPACSRLHLPYRPEAEAHFALPQHKFGLATSLGLVPVGLHGLRFCSPPCPLAIGAYLYDLVVLVNGFPGSGQVDRRDGILSQQLECLPDLDRSERGPDTVQESEPRSREEHSREGQQLLLAERQDGLPVALHIEAAGSLHDGVKTGRAGAART